MSQPDGLRMLSVCAAFCALSTAAGAAQVSVPVDPPETAKMQDFRDGHFGVRFQVPQGWTLNRKDGEVGTFHLDARTASRKAQMRSVLAIQFNPYPLSTFAGARFYFSVERHSNDVECERQATGPAQRLKDMQDIGGMSFVHGHDEHGQICIEARDEVYTAFRRGSCYRFDLAMNTFCAVSSGAQDLTDAELEQIDQRMANILSTVKLDWSKTGPHPVPVPKIPSIFESEPPDGRTPLPGSEQGGQ